MSQRERTLKRCVTSFDSILKENGLKYKEEMVQLGRSFDRYIVECFQDPFLCEPFVGRDPFVYDATFEPLAPASVQSFRVLPTPSRNYKDHGTRSAAPASGLASDLSAAVGAPPRRPVACSEALCSEPHRSVKDTIKHFEAQKPVQEARATKSSSTPVLEGLRASKSSSSVLAEPLESSSSSALACVQDVAPAAVPKGRRRSATMSIEAPPIAQETIQVAVPKGRRRSAVACEVPPFQQVSSAPASAQSDSAFSADFLPRGQRRSAVFPAEAASSAPAFAPWMILRRLDLPPKEAAENYEISDQDSDPDEETEKKRAEKPYPKWHDTWMETLESQANIDPDTIFGEKVPQCCLGDIFTDALYKQARKERPVRKRGSSANWQQDRLSVSDVEKYKKKLGQTQCWSDDPNTLPLAHREALSGLAGTLL